MPFPPPSVDRSTPSISLPAEVLDVSGLAAWLGRHPVGVQQAARAGRLPARRVGKEWRFARDAVAERLGRGEVRVWRGAPAFEDAEGLREPLSSAEAARLLLVAPRTVAREAAAGRLPAWKEAGEWRFDRGQLLRHLRGDPEAERLRYARPRGDS